jgi:hypothetical protein
MRGERERHTLGVVADLLAVFMFLRMFLREASAIAITIGVFILGIVIIVTPIEDRARDWASKTYAALGEAWQRSEWGARRLTMRPAGPLLVLTAVTVMLVVGVPSLLPTSTYPTPTQPSQPVPQTTSSLPRTPLPVPQGQARGRPNGSAPGNADGSAYSFVPDVRTPG